MNYIIKYILLFSLLGGMAERALGGTTQFKTRALWVDASGFSTAEATDKMIAKCQRAGINMILPNVFCYQTAYFKAPHFKGWVAVNDEFDALAYLLRRAHAANIQVQAWCCAYYEGGEKPSNASWLDMSIDGLPFEKHFISPANPEVNPYLLSVMTDLLAYDIDGIHLDYIRYPCTAFDYSLPARKCFEAAAGFDPQNFLDHVDKIVPPEKEAYPVRVLHAKSHVEKIWKTTAIERTLDAAQVGFAFISESPTNVTAMRAPGLLILSGYDELTVPMLVAIQDYVDRGGDVLWSDTPIASLKKLPALQKMCGIAGGKWLGSRHDHLQPVGGSSLAKAIGPHAFFTSGSSISKLTGAEAVAKFENGGLAVTLQHCTKGRVVVLGFDAMECKAGRSISLMKNLVAWFRSENHIEGSDLLAEKRAAWVQWRDDQVTQLVRDISTAAKAKNPAVMVTSSGGPGAWEFYGCYRNARRWLAEGINDFVFPMNYTPDPEEFADLLQAQSLAAPAGKFASIFPGIQTYDNHLVNGKHVVNSLKADVVKQELEIARQQGYEGFCLFAYNTLSDDIINTVRQFSAETERK